MTALATLLLATPLFGFSLHAPLASAGEPLDPPPLVASAALSPGFAASLAFAAVEDDDEKGGGGGASAKKQKVSESERIYQEESKHRNQLAKQHRLLGTATWAAMTVTVGLGIIQYYNLYGFFADQGSNPCVTGNAVFGQRQCYGTPWPHLVAAGVTTALYATTFSLALAMPDPDDLANGKGEFASTLRMHKLLRWVHFGGMVAQLVLGAIIANSGDRANDYGTLQALATAHLAAGLVTYGALTWAGALMTF